MLFRIYLLSFLLHFTSSRVNKHLKILCGIDKVSRDSVAMRFYVKIHNTGKDCKVECVPGGCCSEQGDEENCDLLKLYGGFLGNIPAGESRTVRLAAPLLEPFERRGYCVLHINSKVKGHPIYRDTVTIPFDTGAPSDVTPCARVDQDALNNCQPVDCDTYYNGQKPHYSKRLKRCVEATICSEDEMYDEVLNKCIKPITEEDIEEIKSLSKRNIRSYEVTDVNLFKIRFFECLRSPKILVCVILIQCCFVIALAYYVRQRCVCVRKEKEVLNKYLNKRSNDSITTPLLSVTGTDTTCQFQTDSSSNIDRKIKFYKACQDKRAKASMSDDILSRCLNRRDWVAKPKSSDLIQESKKEDHGIKVYETKPTDKPSKDSIPMQISSEMQVNCFEYEPRNFYTRYVTELQRTRSLTENSAQACFSNDSIDDFISERGLTQSTVNIPSSKTSKNNLDKVLSLLSQKIKPFSDPVSEDLELLHMSRVSVFSSSNASDCEMKKVKESRSSL